jgi:hypothetical protein
LENASFAVLFIFCALPPLSREDALALRSKS